VYRVYVLFEYAPRLDRIGRARHRRWRTVTDRRGRAP
jgi:hypothetical protein